MAADTETFQHYQVLKRDDGSLWELGRGAMGVTYKAFDTNLRSYVALKVINATYLHSETAKARFLREARAAAALSHPNVASVYHLGNDEHSFFYAMEFIDGETLETFVKRRSALPAPLALGVALQVARALRAAHRIGLVHRDIKPANLMLLRQDEDDADEERLLKVIDFGLAKTSRPGGTDAGEASATLTVAGFVGTPHFASPEQLEEKEIDTRSDIYSLGATLWYLLSGKPPFSGSLVQIMSQHLSRTPAFDTLTQAGVPEPAVALLRRMLQKDPADRPQTPGDLRRDIEAALRAIAGTSGTTGAMGSTGASVPARVLGEAPTVTDPLPGKEPETAGGTPSPTQPPGTAFVTVPPPAPGVVLAGRYRLLRALPDIGARGQLFQALDLVRQHAVALKILHPELLSSEESFAQAKEALAQTHAEGAAHPVLIAVHDLVRADGHTLLITDWIDGLSLLEVLRHRGRLPRAEVFSLLDPLAAVADHAREHSLPGLDFNLGQVMLGFDIAAVPVPPDTDTRAALLLAPLTEWPSFLPRVSPLTIQPESGVLSTWAGGRTLVPSAAAPRSPAAGSFAEAAAAGALGPLDYPASETAGAVPSYLRQLARLAYELLGGGTLPVDAAVANFRCPPLAALSERGNAVLRSALAPIGSGGGVITCAYASVGAFVHDLRDAAADFEPSKLPMVPLSPAAPPPPPPVAAPAPNARAAAPPDFAAATTPPPVGPVPPVPTMREPQQPKKGGSGVLLGVGVLLLLLGIVGVGGFYGWRAWKGTPPDPRAAGGGDASPGGTVAPATPGPTVGLAQETPTPPRRPQPTPEPSPTATVVLASPTPGPSFTPPAETPPPPTREEIYRKGAAEAQRLASNGDIAGALESYLELAQNFPDRDPDRSGLDGVVNDLRAKFPPGSESSTRRLRQVRPALEKAAALGSESAAVYLGDSLQEEEPRAAAEFFRQAADRGQPRAMIALGNMYFRGRGVPYDPTQVGYWYQKASDRGSGLAKVLLAECYRDGKGGVRRDPTHAFSLLNEALAIEPNNALAIGELAGCYDKGLGTAPDSRRAFELYKKASDLGNLNALSNLGVFYINGTGLSKPDPRRAVELLRQGAEKDNPQCMFNLAKCLEAGIGVSGGKNPNEASRWYRAAAERGFQPAIDWCQRAGVSFTPKG